jgi:hypothetical protein
MVEAHAKRRPDKFGEPAACRALETLHHLPDGIWPGFEVRRHPTVSALASDDHMVLLSAAASWGAGFFTTRDPGLLVLSAYKGVKIRRPREVLEELPDSDDLGTTP